MDKPAVKVRVDENGVVTMVEVEGHPEPTDLVETKPSGPIPSFGDEEFKARPRTFWAP